MQCTKSFGVRLYDANFLSVLQKTNYIKKILDLVVCKMFTFDHAVSFMSLVISACVGVVSEITF